MLRKTVTINDNLYNMLISSKITEKYSSFSELVSTSLELLIEKNKKEQYKKAMIEASKDKLYLKDMEDIENDFKYVDFEKSIYKWTFFEHELEKPSILLCQQIRTISKERLVKKLTTISSFKTQEKILQILCNRFEKI